uniref:Uncharacterized protein n=1 Tax=Triticum urartu TaxID=4572 RepID=A0A8R7Q5Z1_TRIUA
ECCHLYLAEVQNYCTDDHNGMDQAAKTQSVVDSATLPALKLCLLGQFQLPHYLYTWIL